MNFKNIFTLGFLSTLFACGQNKTTSTDQKISKPVENIAASKDQVTRRAKSEAYCKQKNIPIYSNPNSLFVDPEALVNIRSKNEVVDRALALCYIGLKSEGLEQKYLDRFAKDHNIMAKLTSNEKEYATAKMPTEQQTTDANWRYESLHVMLWALGYKESLIYPDQMCNVADDVKIIHELGEVKFRENAKLRSKTEILDQADLILRLNWACVNARVSNEPAPADLNSSVVYERHFSLNWLINYLNLDWDNVTTDT
jgi:Domain of unknown function (DUF4272)